MNSEEPNTPGAPAAESDLDSLLNEYVQGTSKPEAQPSASEVSADAAEPPPAHREAEADWRSREIDSELFGKLSAHLKSKPDPRDLQLRDLTQRGDLVERELIGLKAERLLELDQRETNDLIKRGDEIVKDSGKSWLHDDYAEDFLYRQYRTDPELQEAWDNRFSSDEARKLSDRLVDRALKKLGRTIDHMVDPELTEDREAVTAAMRGSSAKLPPEKPVDMTKMNDTDFQKHVQKNFGYTPGR